MFNENFVLEIRWFDLWGFVLRIWCNEDFGEGGVDKLEFVRFDGFVKYLIFLNNWY